MLATEFDLDKALQAMKLDGIEQGIEQGIEETEQRIARELLRKGFSDSDIMAIMGISSDKLIQFKLLLNR